MSMESYEWTEFLKRAANEMEIKARELMQQARSLQRADDYIVRRVCRTFADEVKRLRDARAAEMALYNRPATTPGRKTNVGDPTPKGTGGGAKKGAR